jgi:hypothetical protein
MSRLTEFLTGEVSPIIWMLITASLLIGLFFLTGLIVDPTQSVLYATNILVNKQLWGAGLLVGSTIGLWGCWKKNTKAMRACGAINFLLWLFACIGMAVAGHYYLFIAVYGIHLVFHLLLYLGAVTAQIFREPIYSRR